jgi:hypothetical protein
MSVNSNLVSSLDIVHSPCVPTVDIVLRKVSLDISYGPVLYMQLEELLRKPRNRNERMMLRLRIGINGRTYGHEFRIMRSLYAAYVSNAYRYRHIIMHIGHMLLLG